MPRSSCRVHLELCLEYMLYLERISNVSQILPPKSQMYLKIDLGYLNRVSTVSQTLKCISSVSQVMISSFS